jgi:hypothetical protein
VWLNHPDPRRSQAQRETESGRQACRAPSRTNHAITAPFISNQADASPGFLVWERVHLRRTRILNANGVHASFRPGYGNLFFPLRKASSINRTRLPCDLEAGVFDPSLAASVDAVPHGL